MPLTPGESHKLIGDIAELKSDIKYIREALLEISASEKEKEHRIYSLETSRTYIKGMLATLWAGLVWLGWGWIKYYLNIN